MTQPRISVVTVVFNGERHLDQAIRSVLEQSYRNVEYIVVDGGSSDGTLDIIRKYEERISRWVSEPDRGIYDAMNKGIAMATGDLVGFLNCDDWYAPGALECAAGARARGGGPDTVVAGAWNLVFEDIGLTIRATPSLRFHGGMPLSHQAMFVPRRVYDAVGPYDLRYRFSADLDMVLRILAAGAPFRLVDDVLVNFRTSGASEKHHRESGREASEIVRRHLPRTTWILFRIIRLKYETLLAVSRAIERVLGKAVAGSLRRFYFRAKARLPGSWKES